VSIFADDWRACLREHYMEMVRKQDRVTLPSLTLVMYEVGFSDDDLDALRLLATMRADAMPDDYVPPEVAEARVFAVVEALPEPDDLPPEPEPEADVEPEPEPEPAPDEDAHDPDTPQQLTLF
jgi:hypothetical protein